MRTIDADELNEHKFLTPQVEAIGGRHNEKLKEQHILSYQQGWNDCIDAIVDNAPTVEINTNDIEYKAYCKGLEDGKKLARSVPDDISEVTDYSAYPVSESERPQGEWIISQTMDCHSDIINIYTCPFCGKREYSAYPYCHCGAKMKGGRE